MNIPSLETMAVLGFVVNVLGLTGIGVQVGRVLSRLRDIENTAESAHDRIDNLLIGQES